MREAPNFVLRACCRAGRERRRGYVARSDDNEAIAFGHTGKPGSQVAEVEHEVSERTAIHEAAHAVIGHGLGSTIQSVSVVPPECVRFAPGCDLTPFARVVRALAGGAGEDTRAGWRYRAPDTEVADFIARTFEFQGGGCDGCTAALCAWAVVGINAESAAAAAIWRAGDDAAAELLARPDVRAAVAELADALMDSHRLEGATAHQIIEKHLQAGSIAGQTERKTQCSKK